MVCIVLSLFSLSAAISRNELLFLFNYIAVIVILWVRLGNLGMKLRKRDELNSRRILISTFLFVTTLSFGLLINAHYKWGVILTAFAIFVVSYSVLHYRTFTK